MAAYYTPPVVPSITTTVFTTSTTLTSYLTITTGGSKVPDIVAPIEGLRPCSQGIVFENLVNSVCNPSDFACICTELTNLDVAGKVAASCRAQDATESNAFQAMVCGGGPFTPTPVIVTSTPVVTLVSIVTPTPSAVYTPASNGTYNNATTLVPASSLPPAGATTAPPPAQFTGGAAAIKVGVFAGAIGFMGLVFAEL